MFGLSLQKLVFTGVAIAAVWYGLRWLRQLQERDAGRLRQRTDGSKPKASDHAQSASSAHEDAEIMVECGVCGTYVSSSKARSCGRENCPYPG